MRKAYKVPLLLASNCPIGIALAAGLFVGLARHFGKRQESLSILHVWSVDFNLIPFHVIKTCLDPYTVPVAMSV